MRCFKHLVQNCLAVGELPKIISTIAVEDTNSTQKSKSNFFKWDYGINYRLYTATSALDFIVPFGQNQAHNNISPSISAYIWHRTA